MDKLTPALARALSSSGLADELQRLGGADDADALVGFEAEQIGVARDDGLGLGGDRAGDGAGSHLRCDQGRGRSADQRGPLLAVGSTARALPARLQL